MPFNLTKKYNDLLELLGMSEPERRRSLRGVFNRDIQDNPNFCFNGKPIYPTPKEDGIIAMEVLFNHLTRKETDKEEYPTAKECQHRLEELRRRRSPPNPKSKRQSALSILS